MWAEEGGVDLRMRGLRRGVTGLAVRISTRRMRGTLRTTCLGRHDGVDLPKFHGKGIPHRVVRGVCKPRMFCSRTTGHVVSRTCTGTCSRDRLRVTSRPAVSVIRLRGKGPFVFATRITIGPRIGLKRCGKLGISGCSAEMARGRISRRVRGIHRRRTEVIRIASETMTSGSSIALSFRKFISNITFRNKGNRGCPLAVKSKSFVPKFRRRLVKTRLRGRMRIGIAFPRSCRSRSLGNGRTMFGYAMRTVETGRLPRMSSRFTSSISRGTRALSTCETRMGTRVGRHGRGRKGTGGRSRTMRRTITGTRVSLPRPVISLRTGRVTSSFTHHVVRRKLDMRRCFRFANLSRRGVVRRLGPRTRGEVEAELILRTVMTTRGVRMSSRHLSRRLTGVTRSCGVRIRGLGRFVNRGRGGRVGRSVTMRSTIALVISTSMRNWSFVKFLREIHLCVEYTFSL